MLIIPVSRRPDWRHPPIITLLLILLNCLIYFGLQSGDAQRSEKAYRYYSASTLRSIELPRYVKYLEEGGPGNKAAAAAEMIDGNDWPRVLMAMENDTSFMKRLRSDRLMLPVDPD